MMKKLLHPHVAIPLIGFISLASLIAAFVSQYQFGLLPCVLCIYQRWPHGLVAGIAFIYLLFAKRANPVIAILVLADLALLSFIGSGIAGYHVGVEQRWWIGTPACGVPKIDPNDIAAIRELINGPVVRCDEPAWTLFGVSMAGYNFILSVGLGIYAATASIYRLGELRRIHD